MQTYKSGTRVSQPTYGHGTIVDSNEQHTVIDFDDHGVRRFVTMMVELHASAVPAPPKPSGRKPRRKP